MTRTAARPGATPPGGAPRDPAPAGSAPGDFAPQDFAPEGFAPGLERVFDLVPEEASGPVAVEGALPPWLRGTLYLNGPARFHRGGLRYRHWLDGDGMVCALALGADGVGFTSRFVRSHKWVAEEEAGRALYRTFGTRFAGDQLLRGVALASPVNVSIVPFAGSLFALGEQGLPWELDPLTLETRGEHSFGGRLTSISPFSAHPKIDYTTHEMFNFGVSYAAAEPTLTLYRFGADGRLLYRKRHALDLPYSVHDFNLSRRYAVLHLGPYLMDVEKFMKQGASVMESLSWRPELGSRLAVYSRETGDLVASVPAGAGYCLHHVNAFEDEAGHLVVDLLELEEPVYKDYEPLPQLFVDVRPAHPTRFVIDPERGRLLDTLRLPFTLAADFPVHDPNLTCLPYRHFWMLGISPTGKQGRKFLDRLCRGDWGTGTVEEVYTPPDGCYLAGEPVYVAPLGGNGRSEAGVVIVPEMDLNLGTSRFLVVAPSGVVARIELGRVIHTCFHAGWWAG